MRTAKQENITQTAAQLHIAQPALSQTIKRLETELGVSLFDRQGKHIYLNQYGEIVQKYCQDIFASIESMKDEIHDVKNDNDRSVSLSMLVASSLLYQLLKSFKEKEPDIHLHIHQSTNPYYQDQAHDLTIYAAHQEQENDILLLKEPLVVILPRQHPLASAQSIALKDLKDDPFISLEKNSNLHQLLLEFCHQSGFEPKIQLYSDNPNSFRELLDLDMGITLIPAITWQNLSFEHLVIRPISDLNCYRYIYLHLHEAKYIRKNVDTLKNHIIEFFEQLQLPDQMRQHNDQWQSND